jgi:hypothetical protein
MRPCSYDRYFDKLDEFGELIKAESIALKRLDRVILKKR